MIRVLFSAFWLLVSLAGAVLYPGWWHVLYAALTAIWAMAVACDVKDVLEK